MSCLYVWLRIYRFLTCIYTRIPSKLDYRKYREINGKRVIKVIQVIERILLFPWIQWVMIQVLERYETGFFDFQIIWITRITNPSVQTNRTLMSLYKPPSHELFKVSFKPLTIFAKFLILYAWLGSEDMY